MDIEILGIGITVLTPVYAALWHLIQLGTSNKAMISTMKLEIVELNGRLNNCRYCKNER